MKEEPRWSFVKVYLNPKEMKMLEVLRKTMPMSEYFRELLQKEYNSIPK